jgi:hypothetical protein
VDRRTRNLFALVLVVVVAITGGAALLLSDTWLPVDPMVSSDGPDQGSQVEGVIVAVDSSGLADIRGFSLRRVGGEILEFRLGELENGDEFPPGHLAEHQATAEPVLVYYRMEGKERFAVRLEDAGG